MLNILYIINNIYKLLLYFCIHKYMSRVFAKKIKKRSCLFSIYNSVFFFAFSSKVTSTISALEHSKILHKT